MNKTQESSKLSPLHTQPLSIVLQVRPTITQGPFIAHPPLPHTLPPNIVLPPRATIILIPSIAHLPRPRPLLAPAIPTPLLSIAPRLSPTTTRDSTIASRSVRHSLSTRRTPTTQLSTAQRPSRPTTVVHILAQILQLSEALSVELSVVLCSWSFSFLLYGAAAAKRRHKTPLPLLSNLSQMA